MRTEQLTNYRALVEGSRIAVCTSARELPASGVAIVPSRQHARSVAVYYRRREVARVEGDPSGQWFIAGGSGRLFPSLPAAAFAAVTNHLCREHRTHAQP